MRLIERGGPLSLSRQCALLGVSRSSQYYRPKGERAENLALMRRLDELHMAYPFYGSRQLMRHLRREGVTAGRHRIRRLTSSSVAYTSADARSAKRGEHSTRKTSVRSASPRARAGAGRGCRCPVFGLRRR